MRDVKKVLLVTNAATDAEINQIINAIHHAKKQGLSIELNLAHVIPTLPTCYFNIPSMALLAERFYEEARTALQHIGNLLNVSSENQWIIHGKARFEVLKLSNKLGIHFILASSHSIQDLHKSFSFKKEANNTPIQSMSHADRALNE